MGDQSPKRWVIVVGVSVLIAYGLFTWWMVSQVSDDGATWDRLLYLYQGIEAVVFAAAGAVFGTSVQRGQTTAAQADAEKAKEQLEEASKDAEVGRSVEATLRAVVAGQGAGQPVPPAASDRVSAGGPVGEGGRAGDLASHLVAMIDQLRAEQRNS